MSQPSPRGPAPGVGAQPPRGGPPEAGQGPGDPAVAVDPFEPVESARRVAAGGWRRALFGTALGAAVGLIVAGWLAREGR